MKIKFSFWAYGVLAIAALSLIVYTIMILSGHPEAAGPVLFITTSIIILFFVYMFTKLLGPIFR